MSKSVFPELVTVYRIEAKGGLSLRDWFAGMLLVGARPDDCIVATERLEDAARNAYAIADAMLKAREENE